MIFKKNINFLHNEVDVFCRYNYKKLPGKTSKRTISIISKKKIIS